MIREDNAQLYTIEGIVSSILMLMVVIFVVRGAPLTSNTASSSSKNVESQLETIGQDLLTILDFTTEEYQYSRLKQSILDWDGTTFSNATRPPSLVYISSALKEALGDAGIAYNLELRYFTPDGVNVSICKSKEGVSTRAILWNGKPSDNAVIVSKDLVLHDGDIKTASLRAIVCDMDTDPIYNTQYYNNVNVRLTLWRV
jgi:hypothetical protein